MRHVTRALVTVAAIVATSTIITAHDFWLVPDGFRIAPGTDLVVRGQTSSAFPTSLSAVAVDRVTSARVLGEEGEETIDALSTTERSLILKHRPRTPGQKIVAVTLGWRHVKETAEGFRKYLVGEGAEEALRRHEQAGTLPTAPLVRRYAKYGKTVVEVGDGPRAFDRVAGHPLEFVPLSDPREVAGGGRLQVRLLLDGRPLAGARLHAGAAPAGTRARGPDVTLTTDEDGMAVVPVTRAGLWNVRTIHVQPAPAGAEADWEAHWATFVFEVR